ncbi:MAG: 3-mercaptopyruvate sulfurtransferase [Betaproteobacteria bacterium]|nr:3-mercaptopyruvate sulfurtransferase [Betaproteobacteria bacterium]
MPTTIVSVTELAAHLDDVEWIVFDCRFDLADTEAGRRAFAQSHIHGARYAHLDEHLAGAKTGRNGRHPLPDAGTFCAKLEKLGLRDAMQVVAYDASGGYYAARLWWMLRWVGHARCAVLDGGWDAWLKAGGRVSSQAPALATGSFHGTARDIAVDAETVSRLAVEKGGAVVDARSEDRFRGENETLDPVGGHIPGAINRFFKNNLAADGRFKPAAELRQEFNHLLGATTPECVIHQCGSGVTACHNLLAMEIAGLAGSRLYPGSWSEWCSEPQRPIAR